MIRKAASQSFRNAPTTLLGGDRFEPNDNGLPAVQERQRIDRWLWHARLVRTRGAAAALAAAGYIRVNGARTEAPGRMVRTGDVIAVALDRRVRVLRVLGFAERRGPAGSGATLYEDLD